MIQSCKQASWHNNFINMQAMHQERAFSQPAKRRHVSFDLDQSEHDAKSYRSLLYFLSENINNLVRAHRDCLGDLQLVPKIKISRQQQLAITEQLDKIYLKQEDKITKEALHRNANIKKGYQEFYQLYRSCHQAQADKTEETQDKETNFKEQSTRKSSSLPHKKSESISACASATRRPLSSKGPKSNTLSTLTQAYNCFNTQFGQFFKMKTIQGHFKDNPQNKNDKGGLISSHRTTLRDELLKAKRNFFTKSRQEETKRYGQGQDNFVFNGSQIMILDKRPSREEIQYETQRTGGFIQSTKCSTKRILCLKYGQKKSIDQIERMQVQNRINMANSVLAVNAPASQGYRPKSRCWQNYFN